MAEQSRITAITPSARNPERASVRVDGRVVATLSARSIAELDLRVGQRWDEAMAQQVAERATYDKALRRAMNRLAHRAMSRRDLDRKLRDLEFAEPIRQRVLDRLEALGFLDDEAYGRALVRELRARKPAGPFLLRQKLMQKGLERSLIDQLVAETEEGRDAVGEAMDLARRRLRSLARVEPAARYRRLYGLLARRGFEADVIRDALEQLRDELGDADEPAY